MGSGSAFFTFISQRARGRTFYRMYYLWLLVQFAIIVLLVAVLMPQSLIEKIWFGHSREIILLALMASFMQQQIWNTVTQLGESGRQTVKVQLIGLSVVLAHLAVVLAMYFWHWLSITTVLMAIICEYIIASIVSSRLLFSKSHVAVEARETSIREMLGEYWNFCRPLILLAIITFMYMFADRWLLQKYAGSIQQGFYQIASQLAAVSLLATSSILNIFWKEISEANARQDRARVAHLYNKVNRGLIMIGAVISCFMIPWAKEIVTFLLGAAYQESWAVFAIMLLYPIHQSMGQVNGTMFLACAHTNTYTAIAIIGQVVSIPVSYLLLASSADLLVPGLGLGALGLAIKMVGMSVLLVNIQAWLIARLNGWQYEWKYQVIGISALLALGYLVKVTIIFIIPSATLPAEKFSFILAVALSGVIYMMGVAAFVWLYPHIAGLEKAELRRLLEKYNPLSHAI